MGSPIGFGLGPPPVTLRTNRTASLPGPLSAFALLQLETRRKRNEPYSDHHSLISSGIGGNIAGALLKKFNLGPIGNSISGIVGGVGGGQLLSLLTGAGARTRFKRVPQGRLKDVCDQL
jgi:hypothetical protein